MTQSIKYMERESGSLSSMILVAAVFAFLAAVPPAFGHHSFAATYYEDQEAGIDGNIIQFLFRNPHSFVHVEAPDETGTMRRWVVEWRGASGLSSQGVGGNTLRVGDAVTITGSKARDPADYRLRMVTLTRKSDGFTWGMRPDEVVD